MSRKPMTSTVQTRRTHKKVRTGCLTCKARRKKCDEAKPSCQRCLTAGFKCDGYADFVITQTEFGRPDEGCRQHSKTALTIHNACPASLSPSSSRSLSITPPETSNNASGSNSVTLVSQVDARDNDCPSSAGHEHLMQDADLSALQLVRVPNALAELQQISDLEVHCYSYFRHNTVPRMVTYFEHSIWRNDLQNAALIVHHPALFKTVSALGAVHRRFCYGISREAFEYCAHAARLYDDAVVALENLRSQSESGHDGTIAACEALLGIFQCFQGNSEASSSHVRSGVRSLVAKPLKLLHSEAWYYSNPSQPRVICGMMYELYCKASELFEEPALTHSPDYESAEFSLAIPGRFESLRDMKHYLFMIVEEVWRRYRCVEGLFGRRSFLEWYEDRLHQWTSACYRSLAEMMIEPSQAKAFNILSMTQSALCVSIQGNMLTSHRRDMRHIPHLPVFTNGDDDFSDAAVALCGAVDRMRSLENADLSSVKAVFEEVLFKRRIFSFEKQTESDSRVNEMLNLWTIGKHISEVEEIAVIEALKDVIPPNAVYVDICDIWRTSRKVSVRYFEPNLDGGYRWVNQFWSF